MKKTNNKLMKELRLIKWENIITIIMIIIDIFAIIHHIELNGFYIELVLEIVFNLFAILMIRLFVKDYRKDRKLFD